MNYEAFLYLLPYLFSLAFSLAVFVYAWRHRRIRGAKVFCLCLVGQLLTVLGFILELISPNLQTKILWDKFQWLTDSWLIVLPLLIFSVEFSEYKLRHARLIWGTIIVLLSVFTIFLLTDSIHHLIYPNPHLSPNQLFPELKYDFSAFIRLYIVVYVYGAGIFGLSLLIRRALQAHNPDRMQFWILIAGFSIPHLLTLFAFFNITISPIRDSTPFGFAICNLIVAWGLFRYGLFGLAPIARKRILDNMSDPVIVLDTRNRIVDHNQAALMWLGKQSSEVIGYSSTEVFAHWHDILELLDHSDEQHIELSTKSKGDTLYYDIGISPAYDNSNKLLGHIIAARDITRLKNLEMSYRALSEELEQRIQERTEELRASAERYRAVVENQTEFIVRWTLDGRRTFVNDAYCRYFGITPEEAISNSFLRLVAEVDRQGVEEKMRRLTSGETRVETDIHRVIKPDGSIGWQEWTDQAIVDKTGRIVEFQSVGRDISEQKRAEEALRESEALYRQAIEVAGAVPYHQTYPHEGFHTTYDFIGEGIRQLTGYGPEEFNEALWDSLRKESNLLGELAKYPSREAVQRVRSGNIPVWQSEHRIIDRNGTTRWIYEAAVEQRDKDGKSHGSIGLFQDITERKQAEEALRASEAIYRKAIEVSGAVPYRQSYPPEGIHTTYEFIGEGIRGITGYGPEEFNEDLWDSLRKESNLLGELAIYSFEEAIKQVRRGSIPIWQCEHRILARNGKTRWIYEVAVELQDKNGRSYGSIGIYQDITERKQAEEALRESETIYRKAIETAGGVPYRQSYGPDSTRVTYDFIGEGIRQLIGCSPEEFTAQLWDSLVLESHLLEDLAAYEFTEGARRVRLGLNPVWKCEHRIKRLDGKVRWVFESAVELRGEDEISHGSIGLFQDITARKEAEEALRASEERFSKAFRASPVMIVITKTSDARLLEVNEAFEKIAGYKRKEVVGKTTLELGLWADLAARERLLVAIHTTGEVRNEEIRFRKKDGNTITCLLSADLIELGGEKCILAAIQDISERKMAEARILRLNRLYATISHINQAIVHTHDKESLFREICQVAIDHGQFRMAWIGVVDNKDDFVQPVVFAGEEQGYLALLEIHYRDELGGRGPIGTAIREERCVICQDIANDPLMFLWWQEAVSRGFHSSAAVPLSEHGQVIGVLAVYAQDVYGFDAEDEVLLEQIGQDVSFALDSIDAENKRKMAEQNLADAYDTTLRGWAMALELRDKETEGHSRRVTDATLIVARAMGLDEEALIHIRRGSILHDIGKMGIPDDILRKNGLLTAEERFLVENHPQTAYELLKSISYLEKALEIPYCHHEKWDGSGYPRGLQGEEIPLPARIFAVVDVWDALLSNRPYRAGWQVDRVMQYLREESGKHFDPKVVKVFFQLLEEGKI